MLPVRGEWVLTGAAPNFSLPACRWRRPNLHDLEGVAMGTLAGRTTAAGPAARSGLAGSLSDSLHPFSSLLSSPLSLSLSPVLIL